MKSGYVPVQTALVLCSPAADGRGILHNGVMVSGTWSFCCNCWTINTFSTYFFFIGLCEKHNIVTQLHLWPALLKYVFEFRTGSRTRNVFTFFGSRIKPLSSHSSHYLIVNKKSRETSSFLEHSEVRHSVCDMMTDGLPFLRIVRLTPGDSLLPERLWFYGAFKDACTSPVYLFLWDLGMSLAVAFWSVVCRFWMARCGWSLASAEHNIFFHRIYCLGWIKISRFRQERPTIDGMESMLTFI